MVEVSILVNCFNSSKTIGKTITSILKQSYKNYELIIYDNCSNDNTLKICKEYQDPRIKIYKSKLHTTLGLARIKALKYCTGKYISIIDADDIAHEEKIFKQHNFLQKNSFDICYTDCFIFNEKKTYLYKSANPLDLKSLLITKNPIIHSSIMFKRELINFDFFYHKDFRNFQDYNNYIWMVKKGMTFGKINEPLLYYYKSDMTTSRNLNQSSLRKNTFEYLKILNIANTLINSNNLKVNRQKKRFVIFLYLFKKDKNRYAFTLLKILFLNFFFIKLLIFQKF